MAAGLTNKSVLELSEGKVTLNKGNMMDHQTAYVEEC